MQERILQEASDLFVKSGVRSVTMDEISETLGISKRTLYENFSNKEELLRECISYQHSIYEKQKKELLNSVENPLEIIHIHITNAFKIISRIHPNFMNDIRKFHPNIWKEVFIPQRKKNILFTQEIIKRGIKHGYFRNDINPEINANIAHMQFQLLEDNSLDEFSRKEVFEHIVMGFIRGMATEKGLKMINQLFDGENK
ncbi:MAG: TetR/AcrR family transcriptional regulator [Bacteroidota bacterium]